MTDSLSVTASVVVITTAALGSVKFLYTTINDIKDVFIVLVLNEEVEKCLIG